MRKFTQKYFETYVIVLSLFTPCKHLPFDKTIFETIYINPKRHVDSSFLQIKEKQQLGYSERVYTITIFLEASKILMAHF
jgi:hypothetical protein